MSNNSIAYQKSFDKIVFSNGARVISLPSSDDGSNLRGWAANCVVCDEAGFIYKLEDQLNAIAPTLTRDPNAELILTTTPAGKNGYFYKLYQDALTSEDWYVQRTTVHDAIKDGLQLDINQLHTLCPDPQIFAQEYECKFLSEYSSFIDTSYLDFVDSIPTSKQIWLGMDIGSTSDRTAIAEIILDKGIYYVKDITLLNKAEYQTQLDVLKAKNEQNHYVAGFIDENGIGNPIAQFATKTITSKIKGFTWTGSNKTPAYEDLRALIFEHKLKFAAHLKHLIEKDFGNIDRVVTEAGVIKYVAGRDENGHSDATSSLVLALQAAKQYPANFATPTSWAPKSYFAARHGF